MQKTSFRLALTIFFTIIIFTLSACGARSPFEGRWLSWAGEPSNTNLEYRFDRNGQGVIYDLRGMLLDGSFNYHPNYFFEFSWTTSDNILQLTFERSDIPLIYYYEVLEDGNIVMGLSTWPDGVTMTLMRIE